ncbi:hypothetical protein RUM43_007270 [Polyplax serrata]|uniref:Uncharacterized protein n=1 Tax=Polyplax serrata TaxID=468196 RepID=A0AAN8S5D2_POLSC
MSAVTVCTCSNLVYEVPAPIDKWSPEILWPGEQQTSGVPQSQYNIVLNKQNMVFVDPSLKKIHQNPIVLTTLAIDPAVLTPSNDQSQTTADVSLNPCILLKQNPEALLATISENLQMVGQPGRTRLYNTMPSKTRQQNAETQTPRLVRHKESAV